MTTLSVNQLPSGDRTTLEHLLGQPLTSEQQVFIMAFQPGVVGDEASLAAARAQLQETFAAQARRAAERGISTDEADAAVDEAIQHIRSQRD